MTVTGENNEFVIIISYHIWEQPLLGSQAQGQISVKKT
jgi:hypothetical protein